MAQFDETQMNVCGVNNNMVNYRGELFSIHMPLSKMQRFIKNECSNCKKYARWQGCIIGLCTNCEVDYTGCGFMNIGIELHSNFKQSANNTYLKGVNWNEIGDTDLDCYSGSNLEKEAQFIIHPNKKEVYLEDRTKLPYTCTFYSTRDEFSREYEPSSYVEEDKTRDEFSREDEIRINRIRKIQRFCDEAYERFQEKEEEVAVTEEQLTAEITIKKRLEIANTYSFREDYDSAEKEEEEEEEEEEEDQEEVIEVFLTENGKEEKWFEMKIAEYDEEQEAEPINLKVNEQEALFHKVNERFFTETNQFLPPFQNTKSTFWERYQFDGSEQHMNQFAVEFAADFTADDLTDEISSTGDSSTTYTELPELIDDFRINVEEKEQEEEKEEEGDCKEETQEEYELRTQTGIFDWSHRLNEDECSYIGINYSGSYVYDPF